MSRDRDEAPPDEAALHAAAVAHLARFGATRLTLARVLDRRVERWARAAGGDVAAAVAGAKQAARDVVTRLAEAGAVDDAAFALARARRLGRAGRSRAAVAAHLAVRGVAAEVAKAVLPDAEAELAAAVAYAKRRRLGPFRAAPPPDQRRELAALARAGFSREAARAALSMPREAAQLVLLRLRQS
jgi:regulatory protein